MEYKPRRRQAEPGSDPAFGSNRSAARPQAGQSLRDQYCAPAHASHGESENARFVRGRYGAPAHDAQARRGEGDFSARDAQARRSEGDSSARGAQAGRGGKEAVRPRPRARRRDPAAIVIPILMALAVLAGVIYTGSCWLISTVNQSTYCSNIYVNGIDISSYSREEGMERVRAQIDSQLSATHTLSWQGNSWNFTAADFGGSIDTDTVMERAWNIGHVGNIFDRSSDIRSLRRNPIYLTAPLNFDEQSVDNFISAIYNALYVPPTDAAVAADLTSPYLAVEAANGQELDSETARAQVLSLLESGEGGSVLPVRTLEPSVSTAEAMSSLEMIVEYKTDTTARGYNGRFNVRKALGYFYGMIVQPGEEVSFNDVVGPRTEERGWQLGTEYIGAGKTQEAYGGGICQASSTLYGALLKAGMTIMNRSPHSMTVAYVEPSMDAAVTETGSKDLRFRNDTENPITIYTEVTKEYATVQIYGKRPKYRYELESRIVQEDTSAVRVAYIDDVDGEHCYFKDETALYKQGRAACESEGWLVGYDWDTGDEAERIQLSFDRYQSGTDLYWRGTHSRDEAGAKSTSSSTRAPDVAAKFD